ncbi:hypothetical protein EVG20_g7894 [Dentipellis fragilis]|uniref:F-box domain-containing protein n=1 Tax=Dentipellis fragilis TaxID=205917 RepID=A0A4Y9YCF5_9AGAM|nr:hypothetical protein EVG20_g7894 [Dentipellis fragilis]
MDVFLHGSFPNLTKIECLSFFRDFEQHVTWLTRTIQYYSDLTAMDCSTYEISVLAYEYLANMLDLRELSFARLPEAQHRHHLGGHLPHLYPVAQQTSKVAAAAESIPDAGPEKLLRKCGMGRETVDYEDELEMETPRTTTAIIEPLLQLKNLKNCDISFAQLDLDDAFIERFSSACPHLVNLSLQSLDWYERFANMTLCSLYSLEKNCIKLERMQRLWLSWAEGDAKVSR